MGPWALPLNLRAAWRFLHSPFSSCFPEHVKHSHFRFPVNLCIWIIREPFMCLCFSGFQDQGASSPIKGC